MQSLVALALAAMILLGGCIGRGPPPLAGKGVSHHGATPPAERTSRPGRDANALDPGRAPPRHDLESHKQTVSLQASLGVAGTCFITDYVDVGLRPDDATGVLVEAQVHAPTGPSLPFAERISLQAFEGDHPGPFATQTSPGQFRLELKASDWTDDLTLWPCADGGGSLVVDAIVDVVWTIAHGMEFPHGYTAL